MLWESTICKTANPYFVDFEHFIGIHKTAGRNILKLTTAGKSGNQKHLSANKFLTQPSYEPFRQEKFGDLQTEPINDCDNVLSDSLNQDPEFQFFSSLNLRAAYLFSRLRWTKQRIRDIENQKTSEKTKQEKKNRESEQLETAIDTTIAKMEQSLQDFSDFNKTLPDNKKKKETFFKNINLEITQLRKWARTYYMLLNDKAWKDYVNFYFDFISFLKKVEDEKFVRSSKGDEDEELVMKQIE